MIVSHGVEHTFDRVRTPWKNASGETIGIVTVGRDITDRKAAEKLLADTNDELERRVRERTHALVELTQKLEAEIHLRDEARAALVQAQKLEALGRLTSGVAHDFNNILTGISGSFELLLRRVSGERETRLIANGQKAVERATNLIRQLLSFARRQKLEPKVLNLAAMLTEIQELLTPSLTARIDCVMDVPPETWPVMADPNQLQAALLNLAINARDAMPNGGRLLITTRNVMASDPALRLVMGDVALQHRDYVAIGVHDDGTGMPPDVLARAIEPFFTTKGINQGTGLGLAMVYGFATQSGGGLDIDSAPGRGTDVQILLPRAVVTLGEPVPLDDTSEPAPRGNARLLLVDDDPLVRPITASLLREMGYDVAEAADAETAFAIVLRERGLDLVISDMMMQGADGATLARRLRAEQPNLPILFVTGTPDVPALAREIVVRKPFTQRQLAAAVQHMLRPGTGTGLAASADPMLRRLRAPALRELYQAWQAARGDRAMPRLGEIDLDGFGICERIFVVDVRDGADETTFRFLSVGRALGMRAGRALEGQVVCAGSDPMTADEALGSLVGAYVRCTRSRTASYEFARYELGDGAPTLFERLLLPFSDDGAVVTHLAGAVLISAAPSERDDTKGG